MIKLFKYLWVAIKVILCIIFALIIADCVFGLVDFSQDGVSNTIARYKKELK